MSHTKLCPRAWVVSAMLVLAGAATRAEVVGYQLTWENDSWLRGGTDRWYTNGIRGSWGWACNDDEQPVTKSLQSAAALVNVGDAPAACTGERATPRVIYTLGQTMYTPRDITKSVPQTFDRPWAGFLYVAASTLASKGSVTSATELKLGVTGPAAHADDAQRLIHRIFKAPRPEGWTNQLRTRPGVQFSHARTVQFQPLDGGWLAVQSGLGGSIGTLRTIGTASAAVLVGCLGKQTIPALIGNEGDFVVQDFRNLPQFQKAYGFVAVSTTAVARNWLLEANTPYGASSISARSHYGMWQWGFALPLPWGGSSSGSRLVYAQTARTQEFDSERLPPGSGTQRWATVSLVVDLR